MHLAPLILLIACELLLFCTERLVAAPLWLLLAALAVSSAAGLAFAALLRRRDFAGQRQAELEIQRRNGEFPLLNDLLTGLDRGPEIDAVREETLSAVMELFQAGGGTLHRIEVRGALPVPGITRQVSGRLEQLIASRIARASGEFRAIRVQGESAGAQAGEPLPMAAAQDGWRSLTSVPLAAHGHLLGVMHLLHSLPHRYAPEELRLLEIVGKLLGSAIEKSGLCAELSWKNGELHRSHRLLEKTGHKLALSEIKLKQNLDLVERAHLDLSRLERMKSQFLGMVSHEFNTPLTSILSGSDYLLQQGWGRSEGGEVLAMVRNAGVRLQDLVADLLRLINLEARGAEIKGSSVDLERLLTELKEHLQPQLDKRRQTMTLLDLERLPSFYGDSRDLGHLFGELLVNAMKFSADGGEIEVTGRVVDRELLWERRETLERFCAGFFARCGDRSYLEVEVRDHGIGIPAEEQQGIFELFYEVGEIRHHSSCGCGRFEGMGAGLGLALVKGMVEAHGGMVWVESKAGSSFFLLLPLEEEAGS